MVIFTGALYIIIVCVADHQQQRSVGTGPAADPSSPEEIASVRNLLGVHATRGSSFFLDCLGCAVLLCLVLCLTLLASFFLPSHLSCIYDLYN